MSNKMIIGFFALCLAIVGCTLTAPPADPAADGQDASSELRAEAAGGNQGHLKSCSSSEDCNPHELCDRAVDGTCGTGDPGVCSPRPELCPAIYDPVCGCDGITYSSECAAHEAGVDVVQKGECDQPLVAEIGGSPPPLPSCNSNEECNADELCDFPGNGTCGSTGRAPGRCSLRPEICNKIFAPVCGCDGITYGNECAAYQAGVDVAHEGECEQPLVCGGFAGIACPEGFTCIDDPGDDCDPATGADCSGLCQPIE